MSQAHIEKFYSVAVKNPEIIKQIFRGAASEEEAIKNAVKTGKANGYDFSHEEAGAWVKEQKKLQASGELSDMQLEAVAGGKQTIFDQINSYNQTLKPGSFQVPSSW
jgi:hypothetical protein